MISGWEFDVAFGGKGIVEEFGEDGNGRSTIPGTHRRHRLIKLAVGLRNHKDNAATG
jgi:hypothetical protein